MMHNNISMYLKLLWILHGVLVICKNTPIISSSASSSSSLIKGENQKFASRFILVKRNDGLVLCRSDNQSALLLKSHTYQNPPQLNKVIGSQIPLVDVRLGANIRKHEVEQIEAVFGIFNLPLNSYLAVITNSLPADNIGKGVREIQSIDLIEIPSSKTKHDKSKELEQKESINLLKKAFSSHNFYYSNDKYDVTRNVQNNRLNPILDNEPKWIKADDRFFWNINIISPIVDAGFSNWITPVCNLWTSSKNISTISNDDNDNNSIFELTLVSRRSRQRQGPRYIKRGIDSSGNVANFVETEQILKVKNTSEVFSFTQIRGSIPLYWSQLKTWKLRPDIVPHDYSMNIHLNALKYHLDDINSRYTKIAGISYDNGNKAPALTFVNLIDMKNTQGELGKLLCNALNECENDGLLNSTPVERALNFKNDDINTDNNNVENDDDDDDNNNNIENDDELFDRNELYYKDHPIPILNNSKTKFITRHIWFDYHYKCRGGNVSALNELYSVLNNGIANKGAYYHQSSSGDLKSIQTCVIRTNCIDCLDRTNVVQSTIGRWALLYQISSYYKNNKNINVNIKSMNLPIESAEFNFRSLWGDNGDQMSMLYAGTKALKRDVTRTGKRTKQGAFDDGMNSAMRYYINNFLDMDTQKSINLVLGSNNNKVSSDTLKVLKDIQINDDDNDDAFDNDDVEDEEEVKVKVVKEVIVEKKNVEKKVNKIVPVVEKEKEKKVLNDTSTNTTTSTTSDTSILSTSFENSATNKALEELKLDLFNACDQVLEKMHSDILKELKKVIKKKQKQDALMKAAAIKNETDDDDDDDDVIMEDANYAEEMRTYQATSLGRKFTRFIIMTFKLTSLSILILFGLGMKDAIEQIKNS